MPWVAAIVVAAAVLSPALRAAGAGANEAVAPEQEIRRLVVKRYTELQSVAVWRATDSGARADVRFSDVFDQRSLPAKALETIAFGKDRYKIAVMFRTEGDLVCLVPLEQKDTLTKVANMTKGQKITVEGTTAGAVGTLRCVLVDRALTGNDEKSDIEHQLVLSWPRTEEKAKLIAKPGEYAITLPCRYKKGQVEQVSLLVEQMTRKKFDALMAQTKAEGEKKEVEKEYKAFTAESVYTKIGDGRAENVRFQDRVKSVMSKPPAAIKLPNGRMMRVGAAFETYIGITCMVDAEDQALADVCQRLVPGQEVTVKGTTLPPMGVYRPLLADGVEFPGVQGRTETPDVWIVRLFWGSEKKMLYTVGTYNLDLPCAHVEKATERLTVELREVRVIKGQVEGETQEGEKVPPKEAKATPKEGAPAPK